VVSKVTGMVIRLTCTCSSREVLLDLPYEMRNERDDKQGVARESRTEREC